MRIENFVLAQKLNQKHKKNLLDYPACFRGSMGSVSLISLQKEKPQLGFSCNKKELEDALTDIRSLLQKLDKKKPPGRKTPEKQLQSWIIYESMKTGHLPFDTTTELITDEFAYTIGSKKIVADLLGFSKKLNTLFIIELKSKRLLKELTEQLNQTEKTIGENISVFKSLLKSLGIEWHTPYHIKKVAVWPDNNKICKRFPNDINEIVYDCLLDGYRFEEN